MSILTLSACACFQKDSSAIQGHWQLTTIEKENSVLSAKDAKSLFSIIFHKDGKASGISACNQWKGAYTLANSQLSITGAAKTRKRCFADNPALLSVESRFPQAINEAQIVAQEEKQLKLALSDKEVWIFERQ